VGTLRIFLEVNGEYESVVDEFLRDELNYIVVKSWDSASEGVRLLKTAWMGGRRSWFILRILSEVSFAGDDTVPRHNTTQTIGAAEELHSGAERVWTVAGSDSAKSCARVLAPDSETARSLALENPSAFFLAPTGNASTM